MANKRVSELSPILANELAYDDLLLLSDITAHESKKLMLQDLSSFLLLDGRLTGSLHGTASYAIFAASASYVPMGSASYAPTSSWALNIATASYAMAALSASYSLSSSYAVTASYALTSSVQLVYSSAFADYARSASYLIYTPGFDNGTASFAITASYVLGLAQVSCSYAQTSSWAWNAITASQALWSNNALTASLVRTASFLAFNGTPNGTASYALFTQALAGGHRDFGVFTAITQSASSSFLDELAITPALGGFKSSSIEAYGTVRAPFTTSVDGDIELFIVNRQTGESQSLDASAVSLAVGGTAPMSGTLRYPFTLRGDATMYGLYAVYVTASNGVFIEGSRTIRFKISSESDGVTVSTAEPMLFNTYPSNSILLFTSSFDNLAHEGSASQVIFSGSNDATALTIPPSSGVNNLYYTWTLSGLQYLNANNNLGITDLAGVPTSLITMSVASCSLFSLPTLTNHTALGYVDCSNNSIRGQLYLPPSMSFLNCSYNPYLTLPVRLPQGLQVLLAEGLSIGYTPFYMPDTITTMSFTKCPYLNSWLSPSFPTSLGRFTCDSSSLLILPGTIPGPLVYVNVGQSNISPSTLGGMASGLVSNGLNNGYFNFFNAPGSSSAPGIIASITTLRSRGWTIVS